MEIVFSIFLFIGVIALAAVVFVVWLIGAVLRLLFAGTVGLCRLPGELMGSSGADHRRCPRDRCRAKNPNAAKFCRRCGHPLPNAQRVEVRRAAIV